MKTVPGELHFVLSMLKSKMCMKIDQTESALQSTQRLLRQCIIPSTVCYIAPSNVVILSLFQSLISPHLTLQHYPCSSLSYRPIPICHIIPIPVCHITPFNVGILYLFQSVISPHSTLQHYPYSSLSYRPILSHYPYSSMSYHPIPIFHIIPIPFCHIAPFQFVTLSIVQSVISPHSSLSHYP